MKKAVALVAIMGLLIVGCGKQPNSAKSNSWDRSKDVRPMKNGKLEGIAKRYTDKGDILMETTYIQGKKEGVEKDYVKGKLGRITLYKNDKRNGMTTTYYYTPRRIKGLEPYVNDNLHGEYKHYYANGKIQWISQYKNGVRHGTSTLWDEYGDLVISTKYINGQDAGEAARIKEKRETRKALRNLDDKPKSKSSNNKIKSSSVIKLKCGTSSYSNSASLDPYRSASMAKGNGAGEASIYISKNGKSPTSGLRAINFCTERANIVKMPCGDARAFIAGCVSQFGY